MLTSHTMVGSALAAGAVKNHDKQSLLKTKVVQHAHWQFLLCVLSQTLTKTDPDTTGVSWLSEIVCDRFSI